MATGGILPSLHVAEDRHPGLDLRCEPAACQQLAFQCGEEALSHGIVVGVTNRSHGMGAPASRQRLPHASDVYWVPWALWWMTLLGLRLTDRHLQCR